MIGARNIAALAFALVAAGGGGSTWAADGGPPALTDGGRAEAAERFDRAMSLLEQGDDSGALADLERVQAIAPHPLVLYNLGLVHAAMNHPVEAARALSEVLAAPGTLPASRLAIARRTHDAQVRRIARVEVTTNVPAIVEVDGLAIGNAPLEGPIAVAAGTHVVGAVAPGYLPLRRELTVAGEATAAIALDLSPSEARLAHLAIRSGLPGADVLVDGARVGLTPLPASLALAPGRRTVTLRRPGYRTESREVMLGEGATGQLDFELAEDTSAPARRGRLTLAVTEPDPDVVIDGQSRGAYRQPLSLPPGVHEVRILRAGFLPVARLVTVPEGGDASARVTMAPTPETRAAYQGRIESQRRWGWIAAIGGGVVAIGAGLVVAMNRGPLTDAQANIDEIRAGPSCKTPLGGADAACTAMLTAADDRFNPLQTRQNIGLVVLGAGLAAAAVGTVLLLTAGDVHRYDEAPGEREGRDQLRLVGWVDSSGGGLGLGGRL